MKQTHFRSKFSAVNRFSSVVHSRARLAAWAEAGELYALVDSYFDTNRFTEKQALQTRDTDPVFYELIAWDKVNYQPPILVKVETAQLNELLLEHSTERWGVFVVSQASLERLASHFQKFVIAQGPDRNPYFLRFHDAAVLEVLLDTWSARDRAIFFGAVNAIGLPDLDTMDVTIVENTVSRHPQFPRPEDCLLVLRDRQLAECSTAIDRDLVKLIYWHLRVHHAKAVQFIAKATLEERIQISIHRARQYGFANVADLAGFAALMFELAPNFDLHPSFARVLGDVAIQAEAKLRTLAQTITDREWHEAQILFDRDFWKRATGNVEPK